MTPSHAAVVVRDGDQVVDGGTVVLVDHVGGHVEAARRELDRRVQLVPPVPVVAEPLEADHEHARKRPQVELLGGLLVFLTVWTVPGIISSQLLLTRVQLQTLAQIDHLVTKYLRKVFKIIFPKNI